MTHHPRLLLFTRFPEPGRAKTRLIPALGAAGAAALHRCMTERTLATLRATGLPIEVWVTGAPLAAFAEWLGGGTTLRQQGEGDLGARMARALAATPAIIVGADLPALTPAHVAAAAGLLTAGKVALGPAEDGGYYLLGLPAPAPFLFGAMEWGTAAVLAETMRRLDAHGRVFGTLPTLADLDRPEDLARFPGLLPA
jgi:rSAM/selenodomain-associated transferase 1